MIRVATLNDVRFIETLIGDSVHGLQANDYDLNQRTGALGTVFGVDRQMIADGTYFVIEVEGRVAACGGWSARRTPFGGDRSPQKDDSMLDPATDAARIRAFFVHPDWARRGLGRQLYDACERAASTAGFRSFELMATLPGVPLYRALGFTDVERVTLTLSDDVAMPFVRMSRRIEPRE